MSAREGGDPTDMTADLVSFLRDRLAEDELSVVHEHSCQSHTLMPPGSPLGLGGRPMTCNCMAVIRAWRKMEATRRIVERYKDLPSWAATRARTAVLRPSGLPRGLEAVNDRPTHTLRTDHPVRYEIEQIEMIPWAGESERLVPGRTSWSIEPIEFDTPEQARALVGEDIVLEVESDGLFRGIGAYADGARLSVRITGPVIESPAVTRSVDVS